MPNIHLANTCDSCDKHLQQIHASSTHSEICDRCLPGGTILRTCGGCHEVRYCGAECQRKHWKDHKASCEANRCIVELCKWYGPLVVAQRARVLRWAKKNRDISNLAASYALGIGTDEDRSQNHCFLILVKAMQNSTAENIDALSPLVIKFADIIADSKVRMILKTSEEEIAKIMEKQPNCVKLIVFDDSLPSGLGLVHMQLEIIGMPYMRQSLEGLSFDWRPWLHASFAAGTEVSVQNYLTPSDPRQKVRLDTLTEWCTTHGENIGISAYSALNLRRNATKMHTHALRVYLDSRINIGPIPFQFKIRSAEVIDFNELDFGKPPTTNQGLIYTFVVDDEMPALLSQHTLALDTSSYRVRGMYQHRNKWLQHLKATVDQF